MSARSLAAAFAYFTTIPLGRIAVREAPAPNVFGYLPVVGVFIGAICGGVAYALALVAPHELAIAVAFGLSIALTGALHVDGFLDACDALFASVAPQRRLEILDDPHHGTFAIAGFAVLCVVWIASLAAIPVARLPVTLAFAAGTARWSAVLNAFLHPYGASAERPPALVLAVTFLGLLVLSGFVAGWAWVAIPLSAVLSALGAGWASTRLGGRVTGDVYGALILAGEAGILASCAGLAGHR